MADISACRVVRQARTAALQGHRRRHRVLQAAGNLIVELVHWISRS